MKKQKKKKALSRGRLVKILDLRYSRYLRLMYSNPKGFVMCYTCGDIHYWKEIQNWHFCTRANYKYRWSENNCRPQCVKCNIFLNGNYKIYTIKMIEEYGTIKIEAMINDKSLVKITTPDIKEKIEYYKLRALELENHLTK